MSDDGTVIDAIAREFPEANIVKVDTVADESVTQIQPMDVRRIGETYRLMTEFINQNMHEDVDFGTIPGTGKPTLYKPGAEKLQRFFALSAPIELVEAVEEWKEPITETGFPLFHYRYVCKVYNKNGAILSTCEGECNSYETRYRWRWVSESEVPQEYDKSLLTARPGTDTAFKFAVEQAKTTGDYSQPQEYWNSWKNDIASGKAKSIKIKTRKGKLMDGWERDASEYRIPNTSIHSQVNTIMKIAQKRAYVGAIILAANASEYFTQDLDDYVAPRVEEAPLSIHNVVPHKNVAARKLIEYVGTLGVEEPGPWIKEVLEAEKMPFSLDSWNDIIKLLEKKAAESDETT